MSPAPAAREYRHLNNPLTSACPESVSLPSRPHRSTPRRELDQTYTISHLQLESRQAQLALWRETIAAFSKVSSPPETPKEVLSSPALHFAIRFRPRNPSNTGYDLPTSSSLSPATSLQFGASSYNFRANSFDFFAQDDWRYPSKPLVEPGPPLRICRAYTEAQDRIANLEVGQGFAPPLCCPRRRRTAHGFRHSLNLVQSRSR